MWSTYRGCVCSGRDREIMAEAATGDTESGYELMRSYHEKAYTVVSEALDLDELGQG